VRRCAWTLDYALAQARRPHRSGVPLGEREQVQAMLGQSAMDLFAARAALYAAARAPNRAAIPKPKSPWPRPWPPRRWRRSWTGRCSSPGGRRWWRGTRSPRLYRRIRSWRIAEGTTEILRLTVARRLLAPDPAAKGDRSHATQ